MSFLANPPAPTPQQTPAEAPVSSGVWFPEIDLVKLRAATRFDGNVTSERLRPAVVNAVRSVNRELAAWRAQQLLAGYASLADVPAEAVDNVSDKVHAYLRAVYACTQADLVERYRDFDTTGAGDKDVDQLTSRADELRREQRWAISDILGIGRTTVELI